MGNPIFRFTLRHAEAGNLVISEPAGWSSCKLKLERHEEYHSLIEYFDGAFIFYGSNGVDNGGWPFIKYVEQNYGVDATLNIDIEVSFDSGVSFEFIFLGQLDLSTINELKDNRAQIAIIRDDFWSKFISRKGTPANLQGTQDADEETITPVEPIRLDLPAQKIRYVGSYTWTDSFDYNKEDDVFGDTMRGMQLDWDVVLQDDLKKFTLPRTPFQVEPNAPFQYENFIGNFEAPYDGYYRIQAKFYGSTFYADTIPFGDVWLEGGEPNPVTKFFVNKSNQVINSPGTEYQFTGITLSCGDDRIGLFTYDRTIFLYRGEQIAIWGLLDATAYDKFTIFGTQRLTWHNVVVATTESVVKSGEQTIDGVVTNTSHILLKNQVDPADNGIWVTAAGAWTRADYADEESELVDLAVFVTLGDENTNTSWKITNLVETIDVDPQVWEYFQHSDERFREFPCGFDVENYLIITADTTFKKSRSEGMLLHDAGAAIIKSYGLGNSFYSEYLGGLLTNARTYASNGCEWQYAILKGLNIRGYELEDKPFFMSFEQWWKGANPILSLGLGYDETVTTPDQSLIRVEQKQFFYKREISTLFNYVYDISRDYDEETIFNKIEIGYANWQSEDISGIDDPQTKHTYATRFKKVGKGIELFSDFIAASLAIESTRRQTISQSKDYKFDNNIFIVAITPSDTSPDVYSPELDENFVSITNLLNSETRYNSRLTPARNFLRARKLFNGGLQSYLGSRYRFVNGEGNYDMISQMIDNGCDFTGVLEERQDIFVTNDFLHLPLLYTIEINLSWDQYVAIRTDRTKAIGISQTASNHTMFFIKSLEYELVKGRATIKAWPVEFFEITQTDFVPQMIQCATTGEECGDGALDRVTSEGEGRVTSEGECRIIA